MEITPRIPHSREGAGAAHSGSDFDGKPMQRNEAYEDAAFATTPGSWEFAITNDKIDEIP